MRRTREEGRGALTPLMGWGAPRGNAPTPPPSWRPPSFHLCSSKLWYTCTTLTPIKTSSSLCNICPRGCTPPHLPPHLVSFWEMSFLPLTCWDVSGSGASPCGPGHCSARLRPHIGHGGAWPQVEGENR
ncbi:hypothetical protein E2C01_025263 [Portunus trituberculatus]|uniref:Uncharacterized protein n=1 Tax=Portunus trituberculatus TaxID=210409 RepID=A0A5B7ECW2_PORTR|nr:hypothetical protein [Portunus trituberculatus]